jgi:hypothetical protein
MNHETIEIHRQYGRGPDRAEGVAVGEPSGAEIPSRFGCRSKVAVDISRVSATPKGRRDILALRFVARLSSVVPITIKNRSIVEPDHAAVAELSAGPRSHPSNTHIPLRALEGRSRRIRHRLA